MAITAGRASASFQAASDSYEAFFSWDTHGHARVVKVEAGTADLLVKVKPNFTRPSAGTDTVDELLIESGTFEYFGFRGVVPALIQVKCATTSNGATVKWSVAIHD